jgi:hypothetical protein
MYAMLYVPRTVFTSNWIAGVKSTSIWHLYVTFYSAQPFPLKVKRSNGEHGGLAACRLAAISSDQAEPSHCVISKLKSPFPKPSKK